METLFHVALWVVVVAIGGFVYVDGINNGDWPLPGRRRK